MRNVCLSIICLFFISCPFDPLLNILSIFTGEDYYWCDLGYDKYSGHCYDEGDIKALLDIIGDNDSVDGNPLALGIQKWDVIDVDEGHKYKKLWYLNLSSLGLTSLPTTINQCNNLEELYLDNNYLTSLPVYNNLYILSVENNIQL